MFRTINQKNTMNNNTKKRKRKLYRIIQDARIARRKAEAEAEAKKKEKQDV